MSEIVLYSAPQTRASAARWMLEEVGAPYRVETLDLGAGEGRLPAYLKINPMGKVPAITHGDVAVSENAAIALYLAETFPDAGLAPPVGDPQRGGYLKWCVWSASCLEPALIQLYVKFEVARGTAGWGDPELVMDVLADAVRAGPYLLGERFSAADVIVGSGLMSGLMFGLIPERAEFVAYRDRLNARPARQRALELETAP